jgi:copper chaperone
MSRVVSYAIVALVAVWLVGCTRDHEKVPEAGNVVSREFAIEGMHCQGCADAITAALTAIPGVQSVRVSLAEKRAVVVAQESDVPTEKILAAVAAAGYKARAEKPITDPHR